MQNNLEFSIVIPIFNEEENITELYRRLTAVMEKLGQEWMATAFG